MNHEHALTILNKYSPMPDDDQLTQEIVDEYRSVIEYIDEQPSDILYLKPLLHSLGAFDGWGVYEVTRTILVAYESSQIIPYLKEGLLSSLNGRKYWCTLLATDFPDESLIPLLVQTLHDPLEEIRVHSAMALESIGNPCVIDELRKRMALESDEDVIDVFQEAIDSLK
ncbi:HEAT repeat domain-containing protein [Fictibacillus iocasae]|uniref:HEAT repeat domain-containing protein n=1 Tax=Fictibacillus iocasae TaxID=2715437 RepID=A0ABW2NMF9_9BACL